MRILSQANVNVLCVVLLCRVIDFGETKQLEENSFENFKNCILPRFSTYCLHVLIFWGVCLAALLCA
jgi:hypothetical protein